MLAVIGTGNGPSYQGWVLYTSYASTGVDNRTHNQSGPLPLIFNSTMLQILLYRKAVWGGEVHCASTPDCTSKSSVILLAVKKKSLLML